MAEFELGTLSVFSPRSFANFVGNTDPEDTYRFFISGASASAPSNFNASLTGLSQDADIQIYRDINNNGIVDSSDPFISSSTLGGGADESLNLQLTSSGAYIARVFRFGSSNTNYTLRLSNTGSSASDLLPLEINAGGLSNSPYTSFDSLSRSDTADVYRFTMSSTGLFNASVTGISAGADIDARLIRDANSNGIIDSGDSLVSSTRGSNVDEAINVRSLAAGSYFLQTYLFSSSTGSANYTLRMSNTGASGSTPSNLLPTETSVGTVFSPTSRSGSVSINNAADTFRFNVSSSRTINLSLSGLSSDADLRLIRDSNGNGVVDAGDELQRSAASGTATERISRFLNSGDYFAQVYLFSASGSTNYTLSFS